jgi:hypothetical protein
LLDAKNFASSCGISPSISLADIEKAAFWLVVELETGVEKVVRDWHNDCPERRKRTVEIKRSTFAARRQEC